MQAQHSLTTICLNAYRVLQMQLVQFVMHERIVFMFLIVIAELYLIGHVHTAVGILSSATGHTHAATLAPPVAEGPADGPIVEGPPDYSFLPSPW